MSSAPALEVRVCSRTPDGVVLARERWCWTRTPTAADVLGRFARAALVARRRGLTLFLEEAPDDVRALLDLQGLRR